MPHPALHAHVQFGKHPGHSSAVIATLAGAGARRAGALLSAHGFQCADDRMMGGHLRSLVGRSVVRSGRRAAPQTGKVSRISEGGGWRKNSSTASASALVA
jgi:hypothetical protein